MKEHLSYFKVENFKRFNSLELNGLGQINLIVGDNNVGKTTLLEALLVTEVKSDFLKNLHRSLCLREIHIHNYQNPFSNEISFVDENYLKYIFPIEETLRYVYQSDKNTKKKNIELKVYTYDELKKNGKINEVNFNLKNNTPPQYWSNFRLNTKKAEVDFLYLDEQLHRQRLMPFIPCQKSYDNDLPTYYGALARNKQDKKELIKNLKLFNEDIEDLETLNLVEERPHIMVYTKKSNVAVPIASMGEGINRLLRIILQMGMEKNRRLMIDEVDAGIYHNRFKDFWSALIKSAINYDVQIFATTHNEEALKYFKEAINEEDLIQYKSRVKHIKLVQNKAQEVVPFIYSYEQFEYALNNENPIR